MCVWLTLELRTNSSLLSRIVFFLTLTKTIWPSSSCSLVFPSTLPAPSPPPNCQFILAGFIVGCFFIPRLYSVIVSPFVGPWPLFTPFSDKQSAITVQRKSHDTPSPRLIDFIISNWGFSLFLHLSLARSLNSSIGPPPLDRQLNRSEDACRVCAHCTSLAPWKIGATVMKRLCVFAFNYTELLQHAHTCLLCRRTDTFRCDESHLLR